MQGFTERVQVLLNAGTSPDGRNRYNRRTHVENARLEGHAEIARLLIEAGAAPPTLRDAQRFQAAVLAGDADEAARLLAVDPSAIHTCDALHAAARHGNLAALQLGLALGVPIDRRDRQGLTALHHAARAERADIVRELVTRGASLDVRDPIYNGTPLGHARHFASRWPRDPEIVAVLEGA